LLIEMLMNIMPDKLGVKFVWAVVQSMLRFLYYRSEEKFSHREDDRTVGLRLFLSLRYQLIQVSYSDVPAVYPRQEHQLSRKETRQI